MLPNVTINKSNNPSGRPAAGFDFYSGLIAYGTAPAGWTTYSPGGSLPSGSIQQFFTPQQAQIAGIVPYTDNTAATGSITWGTGTSLGTLAAGDVITITVPVPVPITTTYPAGVQNVVIAAYTTVSGDITDATGAALASNVKLAINAQTYITGYAATSATNITTITAPLTAGSGINAISAVIAISNGHTMTNTIVAFTGGTASQYALWFYHISWYFWANPTGTIYFGLFASSSAFAEIQTLQSFATGQIRQVGIFDKSTTTGTAENITGTVSQLQTVKAALDLNTAGLKAPLSILYSPNVAAVSNLATYPNQGINTANGVSVVLSQDGAAAGAQLFINNGQSVGSIGLLLGAVSASPVNESVAYVGGYNMTDGVENNIPALANGQLNSTADPMGTGVLAQLDGYRYIFFRAFAGTIAGTYWNNNHCCISAASPYAYINDNRTIDKVSRLIYAAEVPLLSKSIILNADGTLRSYSIRIFKNAAVDAVTASMITGQGAEPEISGITVDIDPAQKINQTNNLIISASVIEDGVARNITVNLAYGN